MLKYIACKFFWMIFSLWVIITSVFFIMKVLPGGPFDLETELPVTVKINLEKKYNLDKPVLSQYVKYIKNIVKLDFGESFRYRGEKVSNIIGQSFRYSAVIGFLSMLISLILGLVLGVLGASMDNGFIKKLIKIISTTGIAIPNFVLAVFFVYLFGVRFNLIFFEDFYSWKNYIGPIVVLSIYPMSFIIKIVSVNIKKILSQNYVRNLKFNKISKNKILFKYALREAMIPVVTYLAPMIASVVMGSLAIEKIFEIPGLGKVFIESVVARDYYVVFGLILFYSAVYLVFIFVADVIYLVVDPRLRQSFVVGQSESYDNKN